MVYAIAQIELLIKLKTKTDSNTRELIEYFQLYFSRVCWLIIRINGKRLKIFIYENSVSKSLKMKRLNFKINFPNKDIVVGLMEISCSCKIIISPSNISLNCGRFSSDNLHYAMPENSTN